MKIIAMILAAGFGSRLKPITDKIPKPLIKIGNETIIERHLRNLKKAKIKNVIINVSHHAEKIIGEIGNGSNYGLEITYSHERDRPLETLGEFSMHSDFLRKPIIYLLSILTSGVIITCKIFPFQQMEIRLTLF